MDKITFSPDWHNYQIPLRTVFGLFLCLGLLTSSTTRADDGLRSGSTAGHILRGKNIPASSPNVCLHGTSQYCCPGWLQLYPNGPCSQPVCKGICGEGRCIAPNSCRCPDGGIRHTCLGDTPSTHQRQVNADDTKTACEDLRCHQHCSVHLDKAFCSCMRGYHLGIDRRHCQDINECHSHTVPCHQRCVNTPGSFRCSCFEGYVLTSNGRTCRRVNDYSVDGACKDGACEEKTGDVQSDTPDSRLSNAWTNSRPNTLVNQRHVINGGQGQPLFTDDEFQKVFGDFFRSSSMESEHERSRFGRSAASMRGSQQSFVGRLQPPVQSEVRSNSDRRVPVVEFRRGGSVVQASLHTGRQLGQTSTNQRTYGQTSSATQGYQYQSRYPPRNRQGYPSRSSQSNTGYHTYNSQSSRPTHQSSFNGQGSRTYGERSSQGPSTYGQSSSSSRSSRLDAGQHVSFTNGRASVSVGLHHTFDPTNQGQGQGGTGYQGQGQRSTDSGYQGHGQGSSRYDRTSGRGASASFGGRFINSGSTGSGQRGSSARGFDRSRTGFQGSTNSRYGQDYRGSSNIGNGNYESSQNYRGRDTSRFIGTRGNSRDLYGLGSSSQGSPAGSTFRGPEPNYRGSATSGFNGPESPRSMNRMGTFPSRNGGRGSLGQHFLNDGRTLVNQRTGDVGSKTAAQNPFPDLSDGNRRVFIDTSRQFASPQSASAQYQAGTGLRGGGGPESPRKSSFQSGASQVQGGTQFLGGNAQFQGQFPGGAKQFQPNINGQRPFASEGNTFVDTSRQFSSVGQPGIPPDGFPFQSNQQGRIGKQYIQLPDGRFVEDTSGGAIQDQFQVQGQDQGCLSIGNVNGVQTQNGGCGGKAQSGSSGPGGAVVDLSTDGRSYTDPNAQSFQPQVDKIPTCGNSAQVGNGQTSGCVNPTGANWNPTYEQLTSFNDFSQFMGQGGVQGLNQGQQRVGCGTAAGQPNWNVDQGRWQQPIGPLPYGPVNCNNGANGGRLPCGSNGEVSCTGPGYETDLSGGNSGIGGQLPCGARGETSCTGPNGQLINGQQNGRLPCGSNGETSCTGPQFGSQPSGSQFGGSQSREFPVDQSGNYPGIGRSTVVENPNGFPMHVDMDVMTRGNTDGLLIDSGNGNGNGFPIDSGNGNGNGFPIDSGNGNSNGFPIDSGNGNGFPIDTGNGNGNNGFLIDSGKGNSNGFPIGNGSPSSSIETGTGSDSRLRTFPFDVDLNGKSTDGGTDSGTPGEGTFPPGLDMGVPEDLTFPTDGSSFGGSDVIGGNWPSGIPDSSGGTRAKPMVIDRVVEFRALVPQFGGEEGPQRGDIQVGKDSSNSRNVEGQRDSALSFQCPRGKVPRLTKHGIACMLLEDLEEPACKPQCANGGTCQEGKCVCPPGITGPTCNYDIDECTILSTTAQRCPFKCKNTFGSYRCVCPPGQTLNSDGRSCKTVACFPKCMNNGKCVEGRCECPREFTGRYCQSDVNECKNDSSLCQFYCRNTFGSYVCLCPPGSRLLPDKRSCAQETCPHECQKGGVCVKGRCRCPPGYHGLTCQLDINECTHFKPCSHECVNSIGSFSCHCPEGLVLKYDARTCQNATLAAAD